MVISWLSRTLREYAQTGPRSLAAGHDQPVAVEATGDEEETEAQCKRAGRDIRPNESSKVRSSPAASSVQLMGMCIRGDAVAQLEAQ